MKKLCAVMFVTLGGLLLAGCASLPHPTPTDVAVAQERWPDASLGTLEAGRRAFVSYCSGCHTLPLPSSRSPAKWESILDEMHVEAKVPLHYQPLIDQFVLTLSERPVAVR